MRRPAGRAGFVAALLAALVAAACERSGDARPSGTPGSRAATGRGAAPTGEATPAPAGEGRHAGAGGQGGPAGEAQYAHAGEAQHAHAGDSQHARAAEAQHAPAGEGGQLCEHGLPADRCTKCHPDLIPAYQAMGDWDEEHGLPLSLCRIHNPGLTFTAAAPADWCREHAVPESKCTKCNPSLVPAFIEAGDYCREHGFPESVCPICHPELVEAAGQTPPGRAPLGFDVRLASAETAGEAGIRTVRAEKRRVARTLEVVGQLDYDQNRLAQLSPRGEALVVEVRVDVGDAVRAGQPLAVLASGAVGSDQARAAAARTRVETARAALAREAALAERGISSRQSVEQARRELADAEADHDAASASLGAAGASSTGSGGRYLLAAPFSGTVVARDAVAGRTARPDQVLVAVADLSRMWATLDVPEADAALVRAGQRVTVAFEGARRPPIDAAIARVASAVDPRTRSVRVRVELPNPDRSLKAGTFVRARIQVAPEHEAVVVPREAVQRAEGRVLVFVAKRPGVYEPVTVQLGEETAAGVEVLEGLSPGAEVVTTGAFLLKTEILKDAIGAGCCEVE